MSFGLESKFEIFGSNQRVFVRRGVGERMVSACVFPTVRHRGGGDTDPVEVMVWGCFAGDTEFYFEFKAHLTSMATTAFCSDSPSGLGLLCFATGQ